MLDKKISTPFYARFLELCHENNLSPAAAVKAAGISSGAPTAWKNKNAIPKPEQRQKLCELFKVTDSDLMGYEKQKKPAGTEADGQVAEIINLFSQLTPDNQDLFLAQLRAVVAAQHKQQQLRGQAD